ncbi:MAG: hypothetical protein HC767_15640, partial [Akkermansiaceae bacterium]|nr:hypothetical protein [Akkermansiaceae bacterium]
MIGLRVECLLTVGSSAPLCARRICMYTPSLKLKLLLRQGRGQVHTHHRLNNREFKRVSCCRIFDAFQFEAAVEGFLKHVV